MNFINQQKFLKGTPRHLAFLGNLYPGLILSINSTERKQCGLNYLHCGNVDASKINQKISLSEIVIILNSAKQDFNTQTCVLPEEGDPLFDKNFKDIVRHAFNLGMTTYVFNICHLMTRELAVFCKDHDVSIIVSFSDYNEKRYDSFVRRVGAYKNIIKNIRISAQVYSDTTVEVNNKTIYRIAINTNINVKNVAYRDQAQSFAKELRMMSILNYTWPEGAAIENAKELFGKAFSNSLMNDDLIKIVFSESENGGMSLLGPDKFCGMESVGLSIGVGGEILFCPYRLKDKQALGHIDDYKTEKGCELKKVMSDKMIFWEKNYVNICSLRHGEEWFVSSIKNFK